MYGRGLPCSVFRLEPGPTRHRTRRNLLNFEILWVASHSICSPRLLPAMVDNQFFVESREQSEIKARIVSKYFWAWANVIIGATKARTRIAYIDLFAGPGRYEDGTLSTPLLVLRRAIEDPDMRDIVVTVFNDKDAANVGKLKGAIAELPGIESLKYQPEVSNDVVGDEITRDLASRKLVPTLFFLDPWGYKGLSRSD
jgi:three-Cys-motif partner protein